MPDNVIQHRFSWDCDYHYDGPALRHMMPIEFFPSICTREGNSKGIMSTPCKNARRLDFIKLFTEIMALHQQYGIVLLFAAFISGAACIDLKCQKGITLTSPDYPSNYPPRAYSHWYIEAPPDRRIFVSFNDFSLKDQKDFLELSDEADTNNRMEYTGEEKLFPPFLTRGNRLQMIFTFRGIGTRRGFNITVSCFQIPDTPAGRLIDGTSPLEGFLNVPTKSGNLARVCEEGFTPQVAEVVCGELGYPGVKEVIYDTDGCHRDTSRQECTRAPNCKDGTYRLEDCTATNETCTSSTAAVKIRCFEPGYKGCFSLPEMPRTGFTFISTAQCVSLCRGETTNMAKAIAIMNETNCFCSTADEVILANLTPLDYDNCNQHSINDVIYDVSVGFCEQPADVMNGTWDSNITWLGSLAQLTCDPGYSLNGSGTLQCIPGVSPYHPVWNGLMPSCDRHEDGTSSISDNPKPEQPPGDYFKYFSISIAAMFACMFICLIFFRESSRQKLLTWVRILYSPAEGEIPNGTEKPKPSQQDLQKEAEGLMTSSHFTISHIEEIEEIGKWSPE